MIPGKEVFEFTPVFLWDQASSCIGRWLDIEESEVEMLRMAVKLSARGLGQQDAYTALPGLFISSEIDED